MLYRKTVSAQKINRKSLKVVKSILVLGMVVLVSVALFSYFLWFTFLFLPQFSLLHPKPVGNMQMYMTGKVNLLDINGVPASNALVTLDGGQQVFANNQGQVSFEHLMLHDHWLNIYYNSQHYEQALHVHSPETTIALSVSLETHHTISLLLGGFWLAWTIFMTLVVIKFRTKKKLSGWFKPLLFFRTLSALLSWRPKFEFNRIAGLVLSLLVGIILLSPFERTTVPANAAYTAAILSSLPVPTNLTVEQDDNNVILSWNGGVLKPDQSEPAGVGGYKLSWGLKGQVLSNTLLTPYRIAQLQPLVNGQTYQVQVQTVDMTGNLSNPSQVVNFTGDPSRVNALRTRMTGFFDDFNLPAGEFDELKWNQAVSRCNDENLSTSFVNSQFHAHNLITSNRCDRSQIINRPRAIFDFSNRTGSLTFDLDGSDRRDFFYLDLMPAALDITGHVDLDVDNIASYPANMLRYKQNGNVISIIYTAPDGNVTVIAETNSNPYTSLDWIGLNTIPNVRRHWEIKISKTQTQLFINGILVLQGSLNLPFTKTTVHWNHFSYNTNKANEPFSLLHWDNFGFDGPAPAIETHNYRTDGYLGREFLESFNNTPVNTIINIPDSLTDVTARRLMFTLQTDINTFYKWSSADNVKINGQPFSIPKPADTAPNADKLVGTLNPFSVTVSVPASVFKTGVNAVSFSCASCGVLNIHAEFDFLKGSVPTYTPPSKIYPGTISLPILPDVGPGATLDSLGSTPIDVSGESAEPGAQKVFNIKGIVPVHFTVNNAIALNGIGLASGLSKVQLRVDQQVVYEQLLNGAPNSHLVYNMDTTRFNNGRHQLDILAWNNNGNPSIPDYLLAHSSAGDYYPIQINLTNPVTPPPATPTNLAVSIISSTQLNLSWTDNSNTESSYVVERKIGMDGNYSLVTTLPADSTSFQDTNLQKGVLYYYRVAASNNFGKSAYSNEASGTTTLPAPSNLVVSVASLIQLNLSWADNSNGSGSFQIERSTGGAYVTVGQTGPGNITFSDIGLTPGMTYSYRVRGITPYTTSAYSNISGGTTPATADFTVNNLTSLQTVLTSVQSGESVLVSAVPNNMITLTGGLPLVLKQGVTLAGNCASGGPTIHITGGVGLPLNFNGLSLSGNNVIFGFMITGFTGLAIKNTGTGNYLRCVTASKK